MLELNYMRRFYLTLTLIILSLPLWGQELQESLTRSAIEDPSVSRRCKKLLERRNELVTVRKKLNGFLTRSERLENITPENKKTIKSKLKMTKHNIKKELHLANLRIQSMEEDLVLKGCPGVRL